MRSRRIYGTGPKRQGHPAAQDSAGARLASVQAHLAGIYVDRDVARSRRFEGIREEAGTPAHIEQAGPGQVNIHANLPGAVRGQLAIEAVGVGLLDAERGEEGT